MRSMHLSVLFSKKAPVLSHKTSNDHYNNLLNRKFNPNLPNQIWVSDITYIRVGNKWCCLCVIIDLFSRKILSWEISQYPNSELVISTFKKAYFKRNSPRGLIFHSDRSYLC